MKDARPTARSVRWLQALNFTIADVQNGMGPYAALFLQSTVHWNPAQIGTALAFGNIAQVLAQTPAGVLIDQLRHKRAIVAVGIVLIAIACLATPLHPTVPVVSASQMLIGVAGAIFPPTLAAMALGLVGRQRLDRQMGTNQAFNAAGNVIAALVFGVVGYRFQLSWLFYVVVVLCAVSLACLWRIRADDIDDVLARGADGCSRSEGERPHGFVATMRSVAQSFRTLAGERAVRVFLVSAVVFHFANAAMVPIVTQMLGKDHGARSAVLYTSGYMVASQIVFMGVAALSGRLAATIGRKPLLLFAFGALAARGVLYTLSDRPAALIAVQCMDGLGAGIFGVVGVLTLADLTEGTGRFNAAQGAVATAQGIGAFLSNAVAGHLAEAAGTTVTFLVLAAVATAGFALFARFMPETKGGTQADGTRRRAGVR